MEIWVTGCSGFLGRRLTLAMRAQGHQVVGISRRESPHASTSVSLDLSSTDARSRLADLLENNGPPDAVIHAASKQPDPSDRLDQEPGTFHRYVGSNIDGTANLLDALANNPPRQLIYTSSLSVYGRPVTNPAKETDPVIGRGIYSITKRFGEQLVELFSDRCQVTVLRLPSLYGAEQADSLIDGLARLAIKDQVIELYHRGEILRDCLHVDDAVSAIISCISTPPEALFRCMNLGCGEEITTREYTEALVNALNSSSPIIPIDSDSPPDTGIYADISEARRQIGFEPTGLKESLDRYAIELRA
jgi:nucleoside-diphosphate-sugar epimerase